jgi:CubicO group peptidase (beta-lactamase class C family)
MMRRVFGALALSVSHVIGLCSVLPISRLHAQVATKLVTLDSATFQSADSIAKEQFQLDRLGSIGVAIVVGPRVVWSKSYGFADSAKTRTPDVNTVYRAASITKQLTALMFLQLVERGVVGLSDPVERYVPELSRLAKKPAGSAPVTLIQLATMNGGLARDPSDNRRLAKGPPSAWESAALEVLEKTQYVRPPGTAYGYSNIGYVILALALERAAKEPYIAYVERNLLRPLGMTSSGFELTPDLRSRLATGVDWDTLLPDSLNYADAAQDHSGLGVGTASGGLYTTVADLAKLVSAEIGYGPPTAISPAALAKRDSISPAVTRDLDVGYGLGYQIYRWGDTLAVGQSGNLSGYTSQLMYDVRRGFGVVVLRSAAGGKADAGRLAARVFLLIRRRAQPAK